MTDQATLGLSPITLKALMEYTGEHRLDVAVRTALRDAVQFKLDYLEREIKRFEKRYGRTFSEFDRAFQRGEIPDASSYDIERDYLDWEGLISRKKRTEKYPVRKSTVARVESDREVKPPGRRPDPEGRTRGCPLPTRL